MMDGIPPAGSKGPVTHAAAVETARSRITLEMVGRLSAVHQKHLATLAGIGDVNLRAGLSNRLNVIGHEINLLESRLKMDLLTPHYRLENLHDSIVEGLNGIRGDILTAIGEELVPLAEAPASIPAAPVEVAPPPLVEPEPAGINDEVLAETASVPPPAPQEVTVTPAGAVKSPHQRWMNTLDERQRQSLEFLRGFERGALWEKIKGNQVIMHESAKLSGRPIDQVLNAIADLRECRVNGLEDLLSGLAEKCSNPEICEAWGGIHEVLRLASLAKRKSEAGPLTEVSKVFRGIKFHREELINGRYVSGIKQEVVQDLEADGFRGQSRTVLEVKSSEVPLRFTGRDPKNAEKILRIRNQARKLRAALRSGKISWVEYHITAPEVDRELLIYLKKTIQDKEGVNRVRIFLYKALNDWEGLEHEVIGFDGVERRKSIGKVDEESPPKETAPARPWSEKAWVWALKRFTREGGRFKTFGGDPYKLHKTVRQPHYLLVLDGLQGDLDAVLSKPKISGPDRDEAQSLKKEIANFRRTVNDNSVGVSTIRAFSTEVLQKVKELVDRYLK